MNLTNTDIKNLKDKKFRRDNGLFMVEGNKFCKDLLDSSIDIVYTITCDKTLKGFPNIEVVSEKMLSSLATTKSSQEIVCICKIKPPEIDSVGNSLILDNLQDPGNVGTLVRSALAFGYKDVYIVGGADPYSEKVIRSSAGTILKARIHVCDFETLNSNLNKIAKNFLVADMDGENLSKFKLPKGKIAVIVGNEGQGISDNFINLATSKVSISMCNNVESLNAGVAGSIIMQRLSEV